MTQELLQAHSEDRYYPVWSPYSTRFSIREVCELLNTCEGDLADLGAIDINTCPIDDIFDSSVRRRYYNFWAIARISVHLRNNDFRFSESIQDSYLSDVEDELEAFLESEYGGQIHLGAIIKFCSNSVSICKNTDYPARNVVGEEETFVKGIKLQYRIIVFQLSKRVDVLLSQESVQAQVELIPRPVIRPESKRLHK